MTKFVVYAHSAPSGTDRAGRNHRSNQIGGYPINYHICIPQPPLADFVEKFWLYEGNTPQHTKERKLPSGTVELIINLRDDTIPVYDRLHHSQFRTFRGSLLCGHRLFQYSSKSAKEKNVWQAQ